MKDQDQTKRQLISELTELRQRIAELEALGSECKETGEVLRRDRDFVESLLETAQAIVLVLDTEGRIVRFNPFLEEISGYRLQEVQGKDWFASLLPERDQDRVRAVFGKAISGIPTQGNTNPIVTKDGREREVEWCDLNQGGAEMEQALSRTQGLPLGRALTLARESKDPDG